MFVLSPNKIQSLLGVATELFILFVVLISVLILILPIQNYQPFVGGTDTNRDFLVFNHIVSFSDHIHIGPESSYGPPNSPFYYYVFSAPLRIYDSFYTLVFVNFAIIVVGILSLYGALRVLFGVLPALLAISYYGFLEVHVQEAVFIYQPFTGTSIFLVALLFFALYIKQKKQIYLHGSAFFCAVASLVHQVFFLISLLLVAIGYFSTKTYNDKILQYIKSSILFVIFIGIAYIPLLLHLSSQSAEISYFGEIFKTYSPQYVVERFSANIQTYIKLITVGHANYTIGAVLAVIVCALAISIWKKRYTLFYAISSIVCSALLYIVLLSLLSKGETSMGYYLFVPIVPVVAVATAISLFAISSCLQKQQKVLFNFLLYIVMGATCLCMIHFITLKPPISETLDDNLKYATPVTNAMVSTIRSNLSEVPANAYDIRLFIEGGEMTRNYSPILFYWSALEYGLKEQMVTLTDTYEVFETPVSPEYTFLICTTTTPEDQSYLDWCYNVIQNTSESEYIYSDPLVSVFLVKNE